MPGMFPTLFPLGIGGFEDKGRPTSLSFQQQSQYYLNTSDRSFRYHYSYIFVVLNILQRRAVHLHTSFTVKRSRYETMAKKLIRVGPAGISHLANRIEHKSSLSNLSDQDKNVLNLLAQVNTIASHILGSQASKMLIRNEIRNYFGYFGLPHIYFTFNPSAAHSPIFQVMFGDKTVDLSERFPHVVPGRERAIRLAKDPVAAIDFFEFSLKSLFAHLLGWDYAK